MNSGITQAQADLVTAATLDEAKDAQIITLTKQVADLTAAVSSVTLTGIQSAMPETLWYEARSAGAPKTGPHGTIAIVPSSPATADFHPVKLAGNQSDNCYNLSRLYPRLTPPQRAIMETATKFTISCDYMLSPLASVQAAELDYQIRKSDGTVINVGPQLIPDGFGWQVRGFDFVSKKWVPLGVKASPSTGKTIHLEVSATCDGKIVQFTQVAVDGVVTPVTFSHPVTMDKAGAPYINAAYQLDATADAKPYKATVDNLTVRFA